jgi:aminobenzoyl-glutamate utilization protein B
VARPIMSESQPATPLTINRRDLMIATVVAGAAVASAPLPSLAQGAPQATVVGAAEAVTAARAAIERMCREIWNTAELSMLEVKSAQIHIRELEAAGFKISSRATSGFPTAFIAEWAQGTGGPKIGFLPEYDALPGLGNASVPRQEAHPSGNTVGHGCGHNMLGAGCTGAAIALKVMMTKAGTPGTVRVYGCASEEKEGAKVYMARDGLFKDLDACLAWHPTPFAGVGGVRTAAGNGIKIEFHGKTAHAGNSPWQGRSALDAMELFAHGVNLMREHVEPTARMHYVYDKAGVAPNIVPDYASMFMTMRDVDRGRVEATTKWLSELANGAAMGTQTRAVFEVYFGMSDLIPNTPLAVRVREHMLAVGLNDWTADEQAFAKACQKASSLPEAGLSTSVPPLIGNITVGGSTDVADVSWTTPTVVFGWPTMPLGTSLHTWPVTACGGMSIGEKGTMGAARIMAATAYDLMLDPDLRKAAREDFTKRLNGRAYACAIPVDRKLPLNMPASMVKAGSDEMLASDPT